MNNTPIWLAVCALVVGGFMTNAMTAQPEKNKADVAAITDVPRKLVAYCCHGDFRCDSCKKIEQYSREAIEKYFANQLKSGDVEFKVVNMDRPENRHFVNNYQLYTSSLVIAEFKGTTQGRWKNRAGVWNNLDDRGAFYDYVKTEIQKCREST